VAAWYWARVWQWITERYWVPTSLPWRMPWVGSWPSQNSRSSVAKSTCAGSYTTRTTSAWPVRPEQTSR